MFQIFDGIHDVLVGEDEIIVGGFVDEPLKIIVRGPVPAYIVADGGEISTDKLLWRGRIEADFSEMNQVIYVKPNEDRTAKTVITVEAI